MRTWTLRFLKLAYFLGFLILLLKYHSYTFIHRPLASKLLTQLSIRFTLLGMNPTEHKKYFGSSEDALQDFL